MHMILNVLCQKTEGKQRVSIYLSIYLCHIKGELSEKLDI